ncbi:hypothetical protein FRC09_000445 [Ceratobasidium sp. 395]|nr:hypothetical protein FRC09_000445 [Ceratobasidium sp. 395]
MFLYPISYLLISINDILILTLDFHRTGSYVGTVLAQTVVSVLLLVPPGKPMFSYKGGEEFTEEYFPATSIGLVFAPPGHYIHYLLGNPTDPYVLHNFVLNSVHILCTLYLSTSLLLSKRKAGATAAWKSNAKDVLLGSSSQRRPSWFGHPRDKRDGSSFTRLWSVYVSKILFRRVSLVESKRYAFFQNFCALLFIIAIIVRAVTALTRAQNQIETRSGVGRCSVPSTGKVGVLVRHWNSDPSKTNPKTGQGYSVDVRLAIKSTDQYQCTSEPRQTPPKPSGGDSGIRGVIWFETFNCTSEDNSRFWFDNATYTITIRSNGAPLDTIRLPDIWLTSFTDTFQNTPGLQQGFMSSFAPWLVPPWHMVGGKHVEGSIGLIERRFITSSVFRDIVASLEPIYKFTTLFTITTTDTTPSPDNFTSSALLAFSLASPLSYLRSLGDLLEDEKSGYIPSLCTFIEDYRLSTIFDAIGSIGGLLAILQGVHILLFGRPMFWGLTGAKLINPFGILGSCHSRGFRRRLRERYHRQSTSGERTGDAIDTIRINAFLRDFVVDFGPADVDDEGDVESGQGGKKGLDLNVDREGSYSGHERDAGDKLFLARFYLVPEHIVKLLKIVLRG